MYARPAAVTRVLRRPLDGPARLLGSPVGSRAQLHPIPAVQQRGLGAPAAGPAGLEEELRGAGQKELAGGPRQAAPIRQELEALLQGTGRRRAKDKGRKGGAFFYLVAFS